MSESEGGHPIQIAVIVLLLVGGGWYFLKNYEINGLDEVSVYPRNSISQDQTYVSYRDAPSIDGAGGSLAGVTTNTPHAYENPFSFARTSAKRITPEVAPVSRRSYANLKIASWSLDGFGPTKLSNNLARKNFARVVRNFDIVALQQIASIERDLVPRLVDAVNEGDTRFDFVIGESTGPAGRPEQMAFVFDTTRVAVDRHQTYSVEDPENHITFDPLVAWFRAAEPPATEAWTFSMVNVRIDLARAPNEVAMLPQMWAAIQNDGRGEDDILMVGLFQADDAYLLPTLGGDKMTASVRSRPTDIFGKYQTSNVLIDGGPTSEYLGRGGVMDYPRYFELNQAEAETVSSHLPVYAEFSAIEAGPIK